MSNPFDPVTKLLNQDENREDAVRNLGAAMIQLEAVVSSYKNAYKAAIATGWTPRDLNVAGFFDVAKLPKVKKIAAPPSSALFKDE